MATEPESIMISEKPRTEEASESSAYDTGPPLESSKDILDTSIVKLEESLESGITSLPPTKAGEESLSPNGASAEEICKEESEENLQINETGEMSDTSLAKQEEKLQEEEDTNLNQVEALKEQKTTEDSAIMVEAKGNVGQDSQDVEAVATDADNLDEGIVQNFDESIEKEEKIEEFKKEESDGANADNLEEEFGQIVDETPCKAEEPEEAILVMEDEAKTTDIVDNTEEQIVDKSITTPKSIEEDALQSYQENENVPENFEQVESTDQTIEESNIEHLPSGVIEEDPAKEKIFEGADTAGVSDIVTPETIIQNSDNLEEEAKISAEDDNIIKVSEASEDTEAITETANSLKEGVAQNLEENTEESFKEDDEVPQVPQDSEITESVTPVAATLNESEVRNFEETLDKEENTEESLKEDDGVPVVLEDSKSTEAVNPVADNLEENVQNLEETLEMEDDGTEESSEKAATNLVASEAVTRDFSNLEKGADQNIEETLEKENNTEESSKQEDEVANVTENSEDTEAVTQTVSSLDEGAGHNLEETLEKEDNTEESSKQDDLAANVTENSEETEAVTQTVSYSEEGAGQNLEETLENTEESSKQDDEVANVPEKSETTEVVAPVVNLSEGAGQNLEETLENEDSKDTEATEAVTTIASNLEEGASKDIEETPDKEEEESKVQDFESITAAAPVASNLEEGGVQNIEETLLNENNIENDSKEEDTVAKELEDAKSIETVTPVAIDLKEETEVINEVAPAAPILGEVTGQNPGETQDKVEIRDKSYQEDEKFVNAAEEFEGVDAVAGNLDEGANKDSNDVQVAQKKSLNILSKVKHSISKVKKAITGKSSSQPKPVSPK